MGSTNEDSLADTPESHAERRRATERRPEAKHLYVHGREVTSDREALLRVERVRKAAAERGIVVVKR
ncbi:hypothetical protein [Falsiroseomonas oryzae]|uniref:hypothetical protein n=1 Tax=Falsiroseomonas oryzae TaxID=2766473 RepID=UPI0022EA3873|nr:hypothetical protein [Roseomonas sp. MO-31]